MVGEEDKVQRASSAERVQSGRVSPHDLSCASTLLSESNKHSTLASEEDHSAE